jgi:hypothetical protein
MKQSRARRVCAVVYKRPNRLATGRELPFLHYASWSSPERRRSGSCHDIASLGAAVRHL